MVLYGALQYNNNNNNNKSTEKLKHYNIQLNNLKAKQQIVVNLIRVQIQFYIRIVNLKGIGAINN